MTFEQHLINDSRKKYDLIAASISSTIFKQWITDWKNGNSNGKYFEQNTNTLEFDIDANIEFKEDGGMKIDGTSDSGGWHGDEFITPYIGVYIKIQKDWLPQDWSYIYGEIIDIVRHEMEHLLQNGYNVKPQKEVDTEVDIVMRGLIKNGMLPEELYFTLPSEIDANLQGMRLKAKKSKKPYIEVLTNYLKNVGMDENSREKILNSWRLRAEKIGGIPYF